MLFSERLQRDLQLHAGVPVNIHELVMLEADDIALFSRDQLRDLQQLARTVGQLHRKREDAPAPDQAVLHERRDRDHVHVSAGKQRHDVLSLHIQMRERSDREQSRVLDDHLMPLHHVEEGLDQLVVLDRDDLVDVLPHVGEDLLARGLHRDAVGDRLCDGQCHDMPRLHARLHGRCPDGFHADDLHARVQQLRERRDARRQAAAADRDQDHVHVRQILKDLIGDRALARRDRQVVERMHIGQPFLGGQARGHRRGLVEIPAGQDHVRSEVLRVIYLHERSRRRHDDRRLHARLARRVGHALRVVPGRGGHEPA